MLRIKETKIEQKFHSATLILVPTSTMSSKVQDSSDETKIMAGLDLTLQISVNTESQSS